MALLFYSEGSMNTILPIASGKGGVGKTILASNLGVALARLGKTCVLVDLDLGSSNLHTCLGIKNRHPGIGSYIYKKAESLESLLVQTEIPNLFFIPGDSLFPGTANLPYFTKLKIIKELQALVADFIILDLGAGTAYNTLDFFLISAHGLLITTPETTAILSAYSFIKGAAYRLLHRSFKARSREREIIHEFITEPIEGNTKTFDELVERLGNHNTASGERAREQLDSFLPRVVINLGNTNDDIAVGAKLREISRKNVGINMEYIGVLPGESDVSRSILERRPYLQIVSGTPFSRSMFTIARKLSSVEHRDAPSLFEGEDLQELERELAREEENADAGDIVLEDYG
jgi:flagellar biosynthesis protein FlhG